jgi:hypothetical protein
MTIQSRLVYPYGVARFSSAGRLVTLTDVAFQETYGGVIEGAPSPERDAVLRRWFLAGLEHRWGQRATCVVEPEVVEVQHPGGLIRRMPAVSCAAWLKSDPVRDAGAASELVLVWWTESLDLPVGQAVELAFVGVEWERVAQDFDY